MTASTALVVLAGLPSPTGSSGTNTDATTGGTFDAGVMIVAGVVVLLLVLAVILIIGRTATRARQRDRDAGRIGGNETLRGEGPAGMSGPAA